MQMLENIVLPVRKMKRKIEFFPNRKAGHNDTVSATSNGSILLTGLIVLSRNQRSVCNYY